MNRAEEVAALQPLVASERLGIRPYLPVCYSAIEVTRSSQIVIMAVNHAAPVEGFPPRIGDHMHLPVSALKPPDITLEVHDLVPKLPDVGAHNQHPPARTTQADSFQKTL